jgi:NAD(P)-dependent dehydrogenase (short-subunit alcohol dehydrogenase family)
VNAVSDGPVPTEIMNKPALDNSVETQIINSIPLSRLGKAGEVADLITYLAGDNAFLYYWFKFSD